MYAYFLVSIFILIWHSNYNMNTKNKESPLLAENIWCQIPWLFYLFEFWLHKKGETNEDVLTAAQFPINGMVMVIIFLSDIMDFDGSHYIRIIDAKISCQIRSCYRKASCWNMFPALSKIPQNFTVAHGWNSYYRWVFQLLNGRCI